MDVPAPFRYNADHQILICVDCAKVVAGSRDARGSHIRRFHPGLSQADIRAIENAVAGASFVKYQQNVAEFYPKSPAGLPKHVCNWIPELPVEEGFLCEHCDPPFSSINHENFISHLTANHPDEAVPKPNETKPMQRYLRNHIPFLVQVPDGANIIRAEPKTRPSLTHSQAYDEDTDGDFSMEIHEDAGHLRQTRGTPASLRTRGASNQSGGKGTQQEGVGAILRQIAPLSIGKDRALKSNIYQSRMSAVDSPSAASDHDFYAIYGADYNPNNQARPGSSLPAKRNLEDFEWDSGPASATPGPSKKRKEKDLKEECNEDIKGTLKKFVQEVKENFEGKVAKNDISRMLLKNFADLVKEMAEEIVEE